MTPPGERAGWWLWLLAALALATVMNGAPVPGTPETTYLLTAYRTTHPELLANDWTYGAPQPRLAVFNVVAGLPMAVLSMEAVGWLGRIICWTAILAAALRMGHRLGLSAAATGLVVLLWVSLEDLGVAAGWPVNRFMPSAVSFALGMWSLEGLVAGRLLRTGVLLGLSVAVHQSAGLPFALGILGGMIALRIPVRDQARVIGVSFLAALPGILPALGTLEHQGASSRLEWEYSATKWLPVHLGLSTFPRTGLAAVAAAAAFAWVGFRFARDLPAARALSGFLTGPAAVFLFGVVATVTGRYEWLIVYPFRVLPSVVALLALLAMALVFRRAAFADRPLLTLAAAGTLLLLPNPLARIAASTGRSIRDWRTPPADRDRAMDWLAQHTPAESIILMTPRIGSSAYATRRAHVVHWAFTRLDRLPEWRERIEALMGPLNPREAIPEAEARFDALSADSLLALRSRYGGDFLLTRGRYPFPRLAEVGAYRIYRLTPTERRSP
jgi:hypothetical protein